MTDGAKAAAVNGKWNFKTQVTVAVITGIATLAAAYWAGAANTVKNGKELDGNQACFSDYKPSDSKAVEAEIFVEFTATKLYAEWNMQSAINDFVANGMEKAAAEEKAESLFADFKEHPQAVKKYIEEEPRITLPELQAINSALRSDCMKSYEKVLRKIYDHERVSR